jgi:hypothetical protein
MLKGSSVRPANVATGGTSYASGSNALLAALKEELFAVETDKLQGRLTEEEYTEQKSALEVVLRRALVRGERGVDTSNAADPVV